MKKLSKGKKIGIGVAAFIVAAGIFGGGDNKNTQRNVAPDQSTQQAQQIEVTPKVEAESIDIRTETMTEDIPYETINQNDSSLEVGKTAVSIAGAKGVRTKTFEVTYANGVETSRKEVSNEITSNPVNEVIKVGTKHPAPNKASNCDSNYSGCVPVASDVDCAGGSGNGPAYVRGPINVIGVDIYDLDRDGNGIACD